MKLSSKEQVAGSRYCCFLSNSENNKINPQRKTSKRKTYYLLPTTYYLLLLLFFCSVAAFSQTTEPYLIPRQIYIGDPAALIVPLPSPSNLNITLTAGLPVHENIDFHKIALQNDRLIIEFTAFATGELALPLIEIGGHYFPNLTVTVNSLIDRKSAITLSAPASSLAMPGAAFMLYGTMALIISIILASIWFAVKGKYLLALWKEKWKRRRLFANMRLTEKRLGKALVKGADKRIILNRISDELRNFLSVLTEKNCRAMTAREINISLITELDNCRFSGKDTDKLEILGLLKEFRAFIDEKEKESVKAA